MTICLTALLLAACSDDSEVSQPALTIESSASASAYDEVAAARGVTRAWTPPTSYYLYSNASVNGLFANQRNLTDHSIEMFLTQADKVTYRGRLRKLTDGSDKWKLIVGETDIDKIKGSYQAYGFIPRDVASSASLALLDGKTSYDDGAKLTIQGMNTITPSDVCVIVGAKEGASSETCEGLQTGLFQTEIKNGNNYLYFLFDHIYSALRFSFTVDAAYDKLRTIVLKKVELKADEGAGVKAKYNATITLQKNTTGTSPIVGEVAFTPVADSGPLDYTVIFDGSMPSEYGIPGNITLHPVTPSAFMGGFVPGNEVTVFTLRSTYDIYDEKGNLVRQNCTAENRIPLGSIIEGFSDMDRGTYYTVHIKVMPTYLYSLSEPDVEFKTDFE